MSSPSPMPAFNKYCVAAPTELGKSATPALINSVPFKIDWLLLIRTIPVKTWSADLVAAICFLPRSVAVLVADFLARVAPRLSERFLVAAAIRFFPLAGVRLEPFELFFLAGTSVPPRSLLTIGSRPRAPHPG